MFLVTFPGVAGLGVYLGLRISGLAPKEVSARQWPHVPLGVTDSKQQYTQKPGAPGYQGRLTVCMGMVNCRISP